MGQFSQLPKELLSVDKNWKIVIVKAQFNQNISSLLVQSAEDRLLELGVNQSQWQVHTVAGALEIPLAIDWAFAAGYDAAIAFGAVIRGETTHYEYVCNGVERGSMQVQLKYEKPIAQSVLTVESEEQALARCGGQHGNKGLESVDVIVSMLNLKKNINNRFNE